MLRHPKLKQSDDLVSPCICCINLHWSIPSYDEPCRYELSQTSPYQMDTILRDENISLTCIKLLRMFDDDSYTPASAG